MILYLLDLNIINPLPTPPTLPSPAQGQYDEIMENSGKYLERKLKSFS